MLSQEQYDVITTYGAWTTILEVFALLGMTSAGVFNVGLNDYKGRRDSYIASVLLLCNLVTIVFFVGVFAVKQWVGDTFSVSNNLLFLMFMNMLFHPAHVFWITRQKYEYKYKLAFVLTVGAAVLSQLFSILCVTFYDGTNAGEVKLWSMTLVNIAFSLPLYFYIYGKGLSKKIFSYWKPILLLALPLLPHYLAQHVMSSADRIMLESMMPEGVAAIYAVVANVGMIASLIWTSVNASLVPFTFDKLNVKDHKPINRTVILLLAFFAVACVGVSLIAPEIMKILAPESYYGGVYAVPPVAAVAFLTALYNVYANVEFYHKKTGFIALSTIVATIINIGLNWWLIPKYSYVGAAYTTLISYSVLVLMHYLGYKRAAKGKKIYNNALIFLLALVCVGLCLLSSLLYFSIAIRYVLVGLVLLVAIWKRKTILNLLKRKKPTAKKSQENIPTAEALPMGEDKEA